MAQLVTSSSPLLLPGRNCWRVEPVEKAAFLVDGEAYFRAFRDVRCKPNIPSSSSAGISIRRLIWFEGRPSLQNCPRSWVNSWRRCCGTNESFASTYLTGTLR